MLIYDLEIVNAIPDRNGNRVEGIRYCEGWSDYAGMGVAAVCVYDYRTDRPRVFCPDNLGDFTCVADMADCVVGFNNHRFDNHVLSAAGINIPREKSYDILEEVWRSLGFPLDRFDPRIHGGYSLDALCWANFKIAKTGHGANAPINYQRGQLGNVVDYCLADVYLTKRLLDRIIRCGQLTDPKTGEGISVRKPGAQL